MVKGLELPGGSVSPYEITFSALGGPRIIVTKRDDTLPPGGPRLVPVGGFLGAGKTTSITRLAAALRKAGRLVAVITTATAAGESVDAIRLRGLGLPIGEIRGPLSTESISGAARGIPTESEFILLELPGGAPPVTLGSVAHGFPSAPLTVLVDSSRGLKMFGLEPGNGFSEQVCYLFRKQIEHASIVIINRADLPGPAKLLALRQSIERVIDGAGVLELHRSGNAGIEEWLQRLGQNEAPRPLPQFDPEIAAQGERSLAALICSLNLSTVKYFDGDKLLLNFAAVTQHLLRQETVEIAHLKMVLQASDGAEGFAAVSTSGNDLAPELTGSLSEPIQTGKMLLEIRAQVDPGLLNSAVNRALFAVMEKSPEIFARMEYCDHFRPENRAVPV